MKKIETCAEMFVNLTCYCVGMVSVASASRYVTSASRYQSRSMIFIRGLGPRKSTELAETVPIAANAMANYVAF